MTNEFVLDPGQYVLEFDLAGNHRTTTPESVIVQVALGSLAGQDFSLNRNDAFQTYSMAFTVDSQMVAALGFAGVGGDNIGMLLRFFWFLRE